jgi:hypothetical protein
MSVRPCHYVLQHQDWCYDDTRPSIPQVGFEAQKKAAPKALWLMASSTRNTSKVDLETLVRAPIENKDIRDQFEIVHAVDPDDGSKGGMNGGVFVVRMKGITSKSTISRSCQSFISLTGSISVLTLVGKLFIEKRFKSSDIRFAKKEIAMLNRLKQSAYINPTQKSHFPSPFQMVSD